MLLASGGVRNPAGDGTYTGVSRSDVARAAATVLADLGVYVSKIYDLAGPEAFTMTEAVCIGAKVSGNPVEHIDKTVEQAWTSREPYGVPQWEMTVWVTTYATTYMGQLGTVTDLVEEATGRAPLSLSEVLTQQRASW